MSIINDLFLKVIQIQGKLLTKLEDKADISVTDKLSQDLDSKADKTALNSKADIADIATINQQLANKADTASVTQQLANKADKSELANKANLSDLNSKADKTDLAAKADADTVLQQLANKVSINDTELPSQLAKSYCKQTTEAVSGTIIAFKNNISIYKINVTGTSTYSFNLTNLTDKNENSYVFEVWAYMNPVQTISFPEVTWLQNPSMSDPGLYCFTFRTIPSSFTSSISFTEPTIIGNLAYYHTVTVQN